MILIQSYKLVGSWMWPSRGNARSLEYFSHAKKNLPCGKPWKTHISARKETIVIPVRRAQDPSFDHAEYIFLWAFMHNNNTEPIVRNLRAVFYWTNEQLTQLFCIQAEKTMQKHSSQAIWCKIQKFRRRTMKLWHFRNVAPTAWRSLYFPFLEESSAE